MSKFLIDKGKDNEKIKGIIPLHYSTYLFYKRCLILLVIAVVIYGLLVLFRSRLSYSILGIDILSILSKLVVVVILLLVGILLFIKFIILRKCHFDDWIYDICSKRLGTETIYYDSRYLYIDYDRASTKELDKYEFATEMSDKSEFYSYYLVKTYINEGVLQFKTKKKEQIPNKAVRNEKEDLYYNLFPIGLAVNNEAQTVSPIGWYINNQNINENYVPTLVSVSSIICGGTGSGKSVLENGFIAHISLFSDKFMCIGCDCKKVGFNLLKGVKGIVGVALDALSCSKIASTLQKAMMSRFTFMTKMNVDNIFDIPEDTEVDYYKLYDKEYQFDELFQVLVDLDESQYSSKEVRILKLEYPDKRIPLILSIEDIYKALQAGTYHNLQIKERKGYNSYLSKESITKTKGMFNPKIMLLLVDELNELTSFEDYTVVETFKEAVGSIARLGRAAGVHLCLAMQRASGASVSTDLMNNIGLKVLLGAFDSSVSQNMFERDIANRQKPDIKGRGFIGSGKDIIEVQSYYTSKTKNFKFDEDLKETYNNPLFIKQKNGKVDSSGFIEQKQLEETYKKQEEYEDEEVDEDYEDIEESIEEKEHKKIQFTLKK